MRWTRLLAPLFAYAAILAAQPAARKTLVVVAAASMRPALEDAKVAYEKAHPEFQLQISYGASGSLTAQIQQGAPVDVFLAADLGYPEKVVQAGLATAEGVVPYAKGLLVLWVRKDTGVEPAKLGMKAVLEPGLKRVAIANPKLAPYGAAAETALQRAGVYAATAPKLVQAENINQTAQYLVTGAADAGFIALSLMDNPTLKEAGWTWPVPREDYAPIVQGAVVLKRTLFPTEARQFLAYLAGPEGFPILQHYGFEKP